MDERTDEELLVAIAASPGSLAEFYRRHVGRVVAAGARRLDRPEDVADLVATVFLRVLESAPGFDPRRGTAVAWLYGIVGHVASEERRRRHRATAAEERISGQALLDADDFDRLERQIDAAAHARAVVRAMAGLPDADRRLLELVAVDGLTPAEAAAALGISRVAARVRLHRSRRRLAVILAASAARTTGSPNVIEPTGEPATRSLT